MNITVNSLSARKHQDQMFYAHQRKLNSLMDLRDIPYFNNLQTDNFKLELAVSRLRVLSAILERKMTTVDQQIILNKPTGDELSALHLRQEKLNETYKSILDEIDSIFEDRKGLSIIYPPYASNKKHLDHFELPLYFLGSEYSGKISASYLFNKIATSEDEYNKVIEVLTGYRTLEGIFRALADLFQSPIDQIALASFTPVFGGFSVYLSNENPIAELFKAMVSANFTDGSFIKFVDVDGAWVFVGTQALTHLAQSGVFEKLSIWIDFNSGMTMASHAVQPLVLNMEIGPDEFIDLNYLKVCDFDYLLEPVEIQRTKFVNAIQEQTTGKLNTNFEIFDGSEWKTFHQKSYWTYSEQVLMRYLSSGLNMLIQMDSTTTAVIHNAPQYSPESINAQTHFAQNLNMLRISGFLNINPDKLYQDHSSPLEDLLK